MGFSYDNVSGSGSTRNTQVANQHIQWPLVVIIRSNPWNTEYLYLTRYIPINRMWRRGGVVSLLCCSIKWYRIPWRACEFPPCYSPDFNPIENAFSKVKTVMKSMELERQVLEDIDTIVYGAFSSASSNNCKEWIKASGIYNM